MMSSNDNDSKVISLVQWKNKDEPKTDPQVFLDEIVAFYKKKGKDLKTLIVIGEFDEDGLTFISNRTSSNDRATVNWLLDKSKTIVLDTANDMD